MDVFGAQLGKQDELQRRLADVASVMADLADHTADFLEGIAYGEHRAGEHAVRRARIASWERDVASVQRRNAERLRAGETGNLEASPALRSAR